jgi:hypothetical protein
MRLVVCGGLALPVVSAIHRFCVVPDDNGIWSGCGRWAVGVELLQSLTVQACLALDALDG